MELRWSIFGLHSLQFWSAYVPCDGQYKDSLRRLIEQVDVIKRLIGKYPDQMYFATTAAGKTRKINILQ